MVSEMGDEIMLTVFNPTVTHPTVGSAFRESYATSLGFGPDSTECFQNRRVRGGH